MNPKNLGYHFCHKVYLKFNEKAISMIFIYVSDIFYVIFRSKCIISSIITQLVPK